MKVLATQDLRNRLKRKEIAPVYLLFGPETFQRNLAARAISDIVLKDAPLREFNETEVSLTSGDIVTALAAAEQLPMMGEKRVVRVSEVSVTANAQAANLKEADEAALESYLKDPADSTVLIFLADDLDKRLKISKLLIENSVAVEFARLDEAALIQFAKEKVRELGAHAVSEGEVEEMVGTLPKRPGHRKARSPGTRGHRRRIAPWPDCGADLPASKCRAAANWHRRFPEDR